MRKMRICKKNTNKGFTMVELIVVLVLISIMASITIFGGLAWQDWAKFQHEDAMAEEIFYAAQNQLSEMDSSGALESKINTPLLQTGTNGYDSNLILNNVIGDIVYKREGETELKYSLGDIWTKTGSGEVTTNANVDETVVANEKTLIRLTAEAGDYDKYLANPKEDNTTISVGTRILFDIISSYVSDSGALNGSIALEFSPYSGQVFSVCYSDSVGRFVYSEEETSTDGKTVASILDRTTETRQQKKIGYFSVEQITLRNKGKGNEDSPLQVEIYNKDILLMKIRDKSASLLDDDTLIITLFNGNIDGDSELMTFSLKKSDIVTSSTNYATGLDGASKNPVTISAKVKAGKYETADDSTVQFRVPVWKSETTAEKDIYIVLDAADVQAQTLAYKKFLESDDRDSNDEVAFRETYSFYKFGFYDIANYVYAKVALRKADGNFFDQVESGRLIENSGAEEFKTHSQIAQANPTLPKGECINFESFIKSADTADIGITNARHLYNMRYETEYKEERINNSKLSDKKNIHNKFELKSDIIWSKFVNSEIKGEEGTNDFLNSYDKLDDVKAGIAFDGLYYATGSILKGEDNCTDTSEYPFPGFRNLDKNDTFTQKYSYREYQEDSSKVSYRISDLTISVSANIVYGVYGEEIKNECYRNNNEDYSPVIGLTDELEDYDSSQHIKPVYKAKHARAGEMPLGLFAENLGSIEKISLNRLVVRGLEELNNQTVYTCMVGGFAGNNLGQISNLTVLDENRTIDSEGNASISKANKSKINGRTDVGGIIGRESFVVSDDRLTSIDVTISGMENYAEVTGKENVGGIVGRAYTHYISGLTEGEIEQDYGRVTVYDTNGSNGAALSSRSAIYKYKLYHDGYKITDDFKSILGGDVNVGRVKSIKIYDCKNRGKVSGDSLVYDLKVDDNAQCAFIGGIAGCTIDGLVYDDKTFNAYDNLKLYDSYLKGNTDSTIVVEKCNSYYAYDISNTDYFSNEETNRSLKYDNYVGGLIGYAKVTTIKNCNEKPDDIMMNGDLSRTFVFGRRYVGGVCGCSDFSRYDVPASDNPENERVYAVTNYNNVVGRLFVGGIAGGAGIGDISQEKFSFRNPSENYMCLVSQQKKDNIAYKTLRNSLNKGAILSLKSDTMFRSVINKETDFQDINGINVSIDEINNTFAGVCGGIVGANKSNVANCDNLQSEATKKFMMSLISGESNKDFYSDLFEGAELESLIENSKFGGEYVGGIVGFGSVQGSINNNSNNEKSYVDAVIFGQDCVGGAAGSGTITEGKDYKVVINNVFAIHNQSDSSGMAVIGRDGVGGLVGKWTLGLYNNDVISDSFIVKGRYAVGGVCGIWNGLKGDTASKNLSVSINSGDESVQVNGIGYVGGYIGYSESNTINIKGCTKTDNSIDLSNVEIKANFFAGGIVGAIAKKNIDNIGDTYLDHTIKIGDGIKVTADAFAGGIAGLFTYSDSGSFKTFCSLARNSDGSYGRNGTLYNVVAGRLYDSSSKQYLDGPSAYKAILNGNDGDLNGNSLFLETLSNQKIVTLEFNDYDKYITDKTKVSNKVSVEADISAGGLFGYVPDGLYIDVKGFVNAGNIKTNSTIPGNELDEINDSTITCSYLGGVIGRIPSKMCLVKCKNTVAGAYSPTAESYYASNATCLGGLAEVNAGTVTGYVTKDENDNYDTTDYCKNDTAYSYAYGGIAAFAGINGTGVNSADNPAVISFCENVANISTTGSGAENKGYVAGIASMTYGSSEIEGCENKGKITAAEGDAAGILCVANSGTSVINKCKNYIIKASDGTSPENTVEGTEYVAGILAWDYGTTKSTVSGCENQGTIKAIGSSGKAAGIMCIDSGTYHVSKDSGCVINECTNHGAVDAKVAAAGIFGEAGIASGASGYYLAITNDVNTGIINNGQKDEYSAGIAYDTKQNGRIVLCRNYGTCLKYGITAKTAWKIRYCFDATDSEKHIGDAYISETDSTTLVNKYANFYVGKKKPVYFKANNYYSKKMPNETVTNVSLTDVTDSLLGKNNDTYTQSYYVLAVPPWRGMCSYEVKQPITFSISPYIDEKNTSVKTTVPLNSFVVVWDNYRLNTKGLISSALSYNDTFTCSVDYCIYLKDNTGKFAYTRDLSLVYEDEYYKTTFGFSSNSITLNGEDVSASVPSGFDINNVSDIYLVVKSANFKIKTNVIGWKSFSESFTYLRPFGWSEIGVNTEQPMLRRAEVGNETISVNSSAEELKLYCNGIITECISENMLTMGPSTSSPFQLLLNSYDIQVNNVPYNILENQNYLKDTSSYTSSITNVNYRLNVWKNIDGAYCEFIRRNFGETGADLDAVISAAVSMDPPVKQQDVANTFENSDEENDSIIENSDAIEPDSDSTDSETSEDDSSSDSNSEDKKKPDEIVPPDTASPTDAE